MANALLHPACSSGTICLFTFSSGKPIPVLFMSRPSSASKTAFLCTYALFYVLLPVLFVAPAYAQQLVINEIQSSNTATVADEDGDFSDWIELLYTGPDSLHLGGYGLSDDDAAPFKWVFPSGLYIKTNVPLQIWASGKNRNPLTSAPVNGLMREVYFNISGTSLTQLTSHPDYPAKPGLKSVLKDAFKTPADIDDNYGQRVYGLLVAPATGNYTFAIAGDDNSQLWISTDESPANVRKIAEVPDWTNPGEFTKYASQTSAPVALTAGKTYYILGLMKEGGGGDHFTVRWTVPGAALESPMKTTHLFLPIGGGIHTSYSIKAEGEPIVLTNPQGTQVDRIAPVAISTNHSYGRLDNGFTFFSEPTPGKANSASGSYTELLSEPVFSKTGGFYTSGDVITLTASDPNATIIYTLDGSEPDTAALKGKTYTYRNQYRQYPGQNQGTNLTGTYRTFVYTEPVPIADRTAENNKISMINTDYSHTPGYLPDYKLPKGTVIRAKVIKNGAFASKTVTHSYFVFPEGRALYSLPVFSISTSENLLFDYNEGIMVAGVDFENWRAQNPNGEANGGVSFNWYRDIEIPVNLEMFETGRPSAVLNQQSGAKINGAWSREHRLKSLRLYARSEYGKSNFNHTIFPHLPDPVYERFLLRNSGNDISYTFFRDAAAQAMTRGLRFEQLAYRPSVLFLNGEFWGMLNIRERYDNNYLELKYGVTEMDLVENQKEANEGDMEHYEALIAYLQQNNPATPEAYAYINTQMEVESFIDYYVAQLFIGNTDWPGNNMRMWRKRVPYTPNAPYGHDGRWRWMMYDTDFAFNIYNGADVNFNMFTFAAEPNGPGWPNPPQSTYLFRRLLENPAFKNAFALRYSDLLNTNFKPENTQAVVDSLRAGIVAEMPAHIRRWKQIPSLENWEWEIQRIKSFVAARPAVVQNQMKSFFALSGFYTVRLQNETPANGSVRLNRLILREADWSGAYPNNVPLQLEAIPAPGFAFAGWTGDVTSADSLITLQRATAASLQARFTKIEAPKDSVFHAFDFNALASGTLTSVTSGTATITYPGSGAGYLDNVSDGTLENAPFGAAAGLALRVRNPSNTRRLEIALPTTGFEKIRLSYMIKRTSNGATGQELYYRDSPNGTWMSFGEPKTITESYARFEFDFSTLKNVENNPDFAVSIQFTGENAAGSSGNTRIDNLLLTGVAKNPVSNEEPVTKTPLAFRLGENYPNPFNPETQIPYTLSATGPVELKVFDMTGREVATLVSRTQTPGNYTARFNASRLSSGMLVVRLRQNGQSATRKMMLIK
jgi:hypothetical protein